MQGRTQDFRNTEVQKLSNNFDILDLHMCILKVCLFMFINNETHGQLNFY